MTYVKRSAHTRALSHICAGLLGLSLAFGGTSVLALAKQASFYTGVTDAGPVHNTDDFVATNGMTYTAYWTDQSGERSNYAADSKNISYLKKPVQSLVDVDEAKQLYSVIEVQNNTDKPYSFGAYDYWILPRYFKVWKQEHLIEVSKAPEFTSTNDDSKVKFTLIGDTQRVDQQTVSEAASAYSKTGATWSELKQISPQGTLAPGEKISVKIPFDYIQAYKENPDKYLYQTNTWQKIRLYTAITERPWKGSVAEMQVRPARLMTAQDASGNSVGEIERAGKYLATTYDATTDTYTQIPLEYQRLAAERDLQDIHINNMVFFDRHSATVDSRLYSGSWYTIDTRSLHESLKDVGYSVHPGNSNTLYAGSADWVVSVDNNLEDDLYQEYTYQSTGGANIKDEAGNTVDNSDGNSAGISYSNLYEEVRQVVDVKDLNLKVGEAYTANNSLVFIKDHAGTNVKLSDTAHVRVESDVDTSKPGVYHTRYYYYYNGNAKAKGSDYEASKEATITVVENYSLSFDAQGGSNAPEELTGELHGDPVELNIPDSTPVREGYSFVAWNTEADGSGTSYLPSDVVSLDYPNNELVLYAQWQQDEDPNEHKDSGTTADQNGNSDDSSHIADTTKNDTSKDKSERISKTVLPKTGDMHPILVPVLLVAAVTLTSAYFMRKRHN